MSTVRDCVTSALRKIGVTDPNGDEVQAAVRSFSDMAHGWRLQGIDLWQIGTQMNGGFPLPEVNHGEFTAESPFPMPEAYREAAAFCLAGKIAPEYGAPVQFDADMYLRQIQAGYSVINTVKLEPMLFRMEPVRRYSL
jgi:hypothetical protein